MNTSDNPRTASVSPWVSSLKSSGFDTSSLASATDPLVEQALTDTLVQAQGIIEEDFSDSPADLMREKAFQDYLEYCRDQRIFDTIEGALGIESAEESEDAEDTLEDTQGISANETASSQQVQALLANFSPSDENADDNLPQDTGYSSDEDNVDWDDDEDSDDSPGYSSDEDAVDWGDDEDNLDWGDDDRPAPPASPKTAPGGPLAGVGGRNGPGPTPGTYTPQNGSQDAVGRTADMLTSAYDFISASLRSKKG